MSDFNNFLKRELPTTTTILTSVRIPQELHARSERIAKARGVSTSKIIVAALRFALTHKYSTDDA